MSSEIEPDNKTQLRRGWTTGACATAALKAALDAFWGSAPSPQVTIVLPRGETPSFAVTHQSSGVDWAEAGIIKDAGDDPDVTHGALIITRVEAAPRGAGITFRAGEGVGTVTKAGLPIGVGEPAINPVPRKMMTEMAQAQAGVYDQRADLIITVSIPDGAQIAAKTWNPRLGIKGGLSILGTTGIVRPFSCAAWIASIHRGVDVARAEGLAHVAGCTGSTSEQAVQAHFALPDHAMLDMGDFAGGLLKYVAKHPVARLTIGGGFAKICKLAQGEMDLHSARSQVDFEALAALADADAAPRIRRANTALEVLGIAPQLAPLIAARAQVAAQARAGDVPVDVMVVDRAGQIIGVAT